MAFFSTKGKFPLKFFIDIFPTLNFTQIAVLRAWMLWPRPPISKNLFLSLKQVNGAKMDSTVFDNAFKLLSKYLGHLFPQRLLLLYRAAILKRWRCVCRFFQ